MILSRVCCRRASAPGSSPAFAGRTIDQPALFIAGARDWGIHQRPGALERMEGRACADPRGLHLLDGAGHWVQQEQAAAVNRLVLEFLLAL